MPNPYLGEIKLFAGNFAPKDWHLCNGQLLSTTDYPALFKLIGFTYGGDGQKEFALPDLRSRVPLHQGDGIKLAEQGGTEEVALDAMHLPPHSHTMRASNNLGTLASPENNVTAQAASKPYRAGTPTLLLSPIAVESTGSGQPHPNVQPFVCVNFIISLAGTVPPSPP